VADFGDGAAGTAHDVVLAAAGSGMVAGRAHGGAGPGLVPGRAAGSAMPVGVGHSPEATPGLIDQGKREVKKKLVRDEARGDPAWQVAGAGARRRRLARSW
jgi:hypothetical protein